MSIHILGVDLGKNICSLAGLDAAGAVIFRKRIQRHRLLAVLSQIPKCVVAMEACGGAHHVDRFCQEIGHEPRLMSPYSVQTWVSSQRKYLPIPGHFSAAINKLVQASCDAGEIQSPDHNLRNCQP